MSALLLLIASSAVGALTPIRPDQPLAPPEYVPTDWNLNVSLGSGRLATDGTNFLAAWADYAGHIFATRLDAQGKRLDRGSIPIDEGGFTSRMQLVFTGQSYAVIYNYTRPPGSSHIRFRRISTDGKLLDERPRVVRSSQYRLNGVAFNGTTIGVLFEDGMLLTLTPDGDTVGQSTFSSDTNLYPLALAPAGNTFVAVGICSHGDPCLGIRKFGEGETKVSVPLNRGERTGMVFPVTIATNGVNHLIAFAMTHDGSPESSIMTVPLDVSGSTPRLGEFRLLEPSDGSYPVLFPDGAGYVVVWWQQPPLFVNEVVMQHLRADGLADGTRTRFGSDGVAALLSLGGGRYVALSGYRLSAIWLAWNAAGEIRHEYEVEVERVPPWQMGAAIATNGAQSLVAWNQSAGDPAYRIRAAMIDDSGKVGPPIELVNPYSGGGYPRSAPAVASNGTDFLVVWSEFDHVRGRRIAADGRLLDVSPLIIDEGVQTSSRCKYFYQFRCVANRMVAVQWDGSRYVVVSAVGTSASAAYVLANGTVQHPSPANVSGYGTDMAEIALACVAPQCILGGIRRTAASATSDVVPWQGGVFTAPVPNTAHKADTVLSKTTVATDIVAMQRSDAGAIFFQDGVWPYATILASRIGADGSAIDAVPYPVIAAPLSVYNSAPMMVIGDALYWRDETVDGPRLMRSRLVFPPVSEKLRIGATTEIDSLAPIAVAATSRNLYVVYESMYALYLRTYTVAEPVFTGRRRAVR